MTSFIHKCRKASILWNRSSSLIPKVNRSIAVIAQKEKKWMHPLNQHSLSITPRKKRAKSIIKPLNSKSPRISHPISHAAALQSARCSTRGDYPRLRFSRFSSVFRSRSMSIPSIVDETHSVRCCCIPPRTLRRTAHGHGGGFAGLLSPIMTLLTTIESSPTGRRWWWLSSSSASSSYWLTVGWYCSDNNAPPAFWSGKQAPDELWGTYANSPTWD